MQIQKIRVGGFKNIGMVAIDLSEVTILEAENGYGKTNLLQAIEFGFLLIKASPEKRSVFLSDTRCMPLHTKLLGLSYVFAIEIGSVEKEESYKYGFECRWAEKEAAPEVLKETLVYHSGQRGGKEVILLNREGESVSYRQGKRKQTTRKQKVKSTELAFVKIVEREEAFKNLGFDLNRQIFINLSEKQEGMRDYVTDGHRDFLENPAKILYEINEKKPEVYKGIVSVFRTLFPSIERIEVIRYPAAEKGKMEIDNFSSCLFQKPLYKVFFKDKNLAVPMTTSALSEGQQEVLQLLTGICYAKEQGYSLIIVEHPGQRLSQDTRQKLIEILPLMAEEIRLLITLHPKDCLTDTLPSGVWIGKEAEGVATFIRQHIA